MIYRELLDRLATINKIEVALQSKVITFYRNKTANDGGMIMEDTATDFQFALDDVGETEPLTLIINSTGGEIFSGWKIASSLYERMGKVCVIVPEEAWSAATMIALAGQELIMHPKATLGPVDPQYVYRDHLVSALDLLDSPDPVIRRKAKRAMDQSSEYVKTLCQKRMMKPRKIAKVVKRLLLQDRVHASHSSPIKVYEVQKIGLRAKTKIQIDVMALHTLYKKHQFNDHDPNIIIEYSRDPIPSSDKEQGLEKSEVENTIKYFQI